MERTEREREMKRERERKSVYVTKRVMVANEGRRVMKKMKKQERSVGFFS